MEDHVRVGVTVLVFKDGKILLGQRKGSHGAGEYGVTGGHLEYMESIEDCAKRETFEETGITITNIRHLSVTEIMKYAPKHYIDIAVIADWESGDVTVMESNKIESWDWYDLNHLPSPLFASTPKYIEEYKRISLK